MSKESIDAYLNRLTQVHGKKNYREQLESEIKTYTDRKVPCALLSNSANLTHMQPFKNVQAKTFVCANSPQIPPLL